MLGFHPASFWPSTKQVGGEGGLTSLQGFEYGTTTQSLHEIREQSTIIQGLDHNTKGGHFGIHSFLSGVKQNEASSMPNGNVTIDQFAAEHVVGQTRFSSLTIGSLEGIHGGCQLSWTRTGTRVPPIPGPEQLFKKLFVDVTENDKDSAAGLFALQKLYLRRCPEIRRMIWSGLLISEISTNLMSTLHLFVMSKKESNKDVAGLMFRSQKQ